MRAALLALSLLGAAAPLAAQTHLVIVSGLSGEPQYAQRYRAWAGALIEAAKTRYHVPTDHITYLAEREGGTPAAAGRATAETVLAALAGLAARAEPGAVVVIVLLGHGSAQEGASRFNLPGPDLTADALADALKAFETQQVVVVNAASASGDWIAPLAGERRVVITATRSGLERNETTFGQYFAAAFASDEADADKDQRVSIFEAFTYAKRAVAQVNERSDRLLTEHALLEDDGDGKGSETPDPRNGDGAVARTLFLAGSTTPAAVAGADPELRALVAARDSLERLIAAHRTKRDSMTARAYQDELERLLLDLARTNRAIKQREGGRP